MDEHKWAAKKGDQVRLRADYAHKLTVSNAEIVIAQGKLGTVLYDSPMPVRRAPGVVENDALWVQFDMAPFFRLNLWVHKARVEKVKKEVR